MKWKGWMAGFKAFSRIHTTGCVFPLFSFIFLHSGRYAAEIFPNEDNVIQGAKSQSWGLMRLKGCESRYRVETCIQSNMFAHCQDSAQRANVHTFLQAIVRLCITFLPVQLTNTYLILDGNEGDIFNSIKQMYVTYGQLLNQILYNVSRNMTD